MRILAVVFTCPLLLTGCARLVFNDDVVDGALPYRETVSYLWIATNKDCSKTATVLSIPGKEKSITLQPGYGSANLTVTLKDGMIQSVGQNTDSKIPETITAITGAAKLAGVAALDTCTPAGELYSLADGKPNAKIALP